jgi:hypothetical protein
MKTRIATNDPRAHREAPPGRGNPVVAELVGIGIASPRNGPKGLAIRGSQ